MEKIEYCNIAIKTPKSFNSSNKTDYKTQKKNRSNFFSNARQGVIKHPTERKINEMIFLLNVYIEFC